ncbi:hypothetical protein [Thermorudis peleae]|uniref:hypothetical protein n=1 Tax=Thermorudis peleae TaxID=1382356 RepID=UPI0012E0B47E|nr:hypothetical protein [Thermorudis peleae]
MRMPLPTLRRNTLVLAGLLGFTLLLCRIAALPHAMAHTPDHLLLTLPDRPVERYDATPSNSVLALVVTPFNLVAMVSGHESLPQAAHLGAQLLSHATARAHDAHALPPGELVFCQLAIVLVALTCWLSYRALGVIVLYLLSGNSVTPAVGVLGIPPCLPDALARFQCFRK